MGLFESDLLGSIIKEGNGPGDCPHFHPLLMFKILVLQRLHRLTDDATSFQNLCATKSTYLLEMVLVPHGHRGVQSYSGVDNLGHFLR